MVSFSEQLYETCLHFLDEDAARDILGSMESVSFKAGTRLYRYGEQGDCMYFVVRGRVAVQNSSGFGERMQVVALLDAGAPVGEQGILGHATRGSTVVAVKDSELLVLTRSAFETLVGENSSLAATFLQYLLGRVSLRLQKCSERLAHVL